MEGEMEFAPAFLDAEGLEVVETTEATGED